MMAKLADIFTLQMGKTPARANEKYWNNGDNAWVSISDLSTYGKYVGDTKETISDLAVEDSGIKPVPADTVIMSFKLSLGKTAITTEPIYTNEAIMAFIPNGKYKVCPSYFYHLFSGRDWSKGTNRAVMGITLNKATLGEVDIDLPDIAVQEEIADKFDAIDAVILQTQQELIKLDDLVKSRFIELFGDPIQNNMGWHTCPLSDCLISIENGKSFVCNTEPRKGTWPAVLKLSAATYGYYQPEENKAVMDIDQFSENTEVHCGDLLFTRKNTPELVGMCAYVYDTPARLMMPDLIFRLETNNSCNKIFLWKLINHDLFRDRISSIATGSAKSMSNISKERLSNVTMILPPIELQNEFAAFVEQTDKLKLEVKKSLEKLETLKKSLMQQYFG